MGEEPGNKLQTASTELVILKNLFVPEEITVLRLGRLTAFELASLLKPEFP